MILLVSVGTKSNLILNLSFNIAIIPLLVYEQYFSHHNVFISPIIIKLLVFKNVRYCVVEYVTISYSLPQKYEKCHRISTPAGTSGNINKAHNDSIVNQPIATFWEQVPAHIRVKVPKLQVIDFQ